MTVPNEELASKAAAGETPAIKALEQKEGTYKDAAGAGQAAVPQMPKGADPKPYTLKGA